MFHEKVVESTVLRAGDVFLYEGRSWVVDLDPLIHKGSGLIKASAPWTACKLVDLLFSDIVRWNSYTVPKGVLDNSELKPDTLPLGYTSPIIKFPPPQEFKTLAVAKSSGVKWEHSTSPMYLSLHVDFEGGGSQDVLALCLDDWDEAKDICYSNGYGMNLIRAVHDFFQVKNLSEIKGKFFYVIKDGESLSAKVLGLEHFKLNGGDKLILKDIKDGKG